MPDKPTVLFTQCVIPAKAGIHRRRMPSSATLCVAGSRVKRGMTGEGVASNRPVALPALTSAPRLLVCALLLACALLAVGTLGGCTDTGSAGGSGAVESEGGSAGSGGGTAGGGSAGAGESEGGGAGGGPNVSAASDEIPDENYLTAAELNDLLQAGSNIPIFDARLYSRFALGHIPNAKWTPYKTLEERLYSIPHDEEFVIAFLNTKEAQGGWKILLDNGYDPAKIHVLKNGMDDWLRDGYEIAVETQLGC